jgi:hypothetical protein
MTIFGNMRRVAPPRAYLQHKAGPNGPFRTESVPVKQTLLPRKGQTQTGYGKALPTCYMVHYRDRWRRVLCACFSNSGTTYIMIDGVFTVVQVQE